MRVICLLAALLLAGCGRTGLSIPQSPLLKYVERKSGSIACASSDGNITIMDQGGGGVRELTSDGRARDEAGGDSPFVYYQLPQWSRDGTRLASIRLSGTGDQVQEARIVVVSVERGEAVTLYSGTTQVPEVLSWSPDSTRLVFLAQSPSGSSYGFYLVPASGGEPVLLDAGTPYRWCWSPRAPELLIHAGSAAGGLASDRLAFLDVEGAVLEEGLGLEAGLFDTPAWSPDGRTVLVTAWVEGKNRLLLTDRKRSQGAYLATSEGSLAFSFSPKGERVAYVATTSDDAGVHARLYVAPVPGRLEAEAELASDAGTSKATLLSGSDIVAAFFWSPDGRRIAYFVPGLATVSDGQEAEGEESGAQQVMVLTLKVAARPGSGPTAQAGDQGAGTAREVATFLPTPSFLGLVQDFAELGQGLRIWSPDSRNIVYAAIDEQGPAIMVAMAGEGIAPRRISGGLGASWSWK